jgi:hypothetical protein
MILGTRRRFFPGLDSKRYPRLGCLNGCAAEDIAWDAFRVDGAPS